MRTLMLGSLLCTAGALAADDIALYSAVYTLEHKGRDRGESVFTVEHDIARDVYTFRSSTEVKGMVLRLVAPNAIVEHSEFELEAGRIRPLAFSYEDGSRSGDDNYAASFEWQANRVTLTGEDGRIELPIEGRVLDRGSMQVALSRDVAAGRDPGPYVLADEDSLKTYRYADEGAHEIDTALGRFTARRFRQQRDGSSRYTVLWLVPELEYLPARIEQYRDGEVDTALVIESLELR